jgi:hypothetical protein
MLKIRLEAAKEVANCLFAAEEAIDIAIARAAELASAMPIARAKAKLSTVVGHGALDQAAKSFAMLIQAREAIIATHHDLAETKDLIGLRTYSMGGLGKTITGELSHLKLVDKQAA